MRITIHLGDVGLTFAEGYAKQMRFLETRIPRLFLGWLIPRLQHELAQNFETEGAHWSGGWAPLSDEWRRVKGIDGAPPVIGEYGGAMRRALVEGGYGNKTIIGRNRLTYGVDTDVLPYARWFAEGWRDERDGRAAPARPLFPPDSAQATFFRIELPLLLRRWALQTLDGYT